MIDIFTIIGTMAGIFGLIFSYLAWKKAGKVSDAVEELKNEIKSKKTKALVRNDLQKISQQSGKVIKSIKKKKGTVDTEIIADISMISGRLKAILKPMKTCFDSDECNVEDFEQLIDMVTAFRQGQISQEAISSKFLECLAEIEAMAKQEGENYDI